MVRAYNPIQIGERHGKFTIVRKGERVGPTSYWIVRCDCGTEQRISCSNFRAHSAGCKKCSHAAGGLKRRTADGDARKTHLYSVWANMRSRCERPDADNYRWYGGKGIRVCDAWKTFPVFKAWALSHGYRDDLTIDRINTDVGYQPDNCQWITQSQNSKKARAADPRSKRLHFPLEMFFGYM